MSEQTTEELRGTPEEREIVRLEKLVQSQADEIKFLVKHCNETKTHFVKQVNELAQTITDLTEERDRLRRLYDGATKDTDRIRDEWASLSLNKDELTAENERLNRKSEADDSSLKNSDEAFNILDSKNKALTAKLEDAKSLLQEMDKYLRPHPDNYIGNGSVFHCQIVQTIAEIEASE